MKATLCDPSIEYETYTTSSRGARYTLYPVQGIHSVEDVIRSRHWLRVNHNVESLEIRWKREGDISPNPEKIPDFIIIQELKKELGKKESYILELLEKINKKVSEEDIELRRKQKKEILSENLYKQINQQLTKAQKEIRNLRKTISDLLIKLNSKQ